MATLNIKNFPDRLYRRITQRAGRHRRSIAQEVIQLLDEAVTKPAPLSLLELEGLGEETWRAILGDKDAAEYIRDERDSWT